MRRRYLLCLTALLAGCAAPPDGPLDAPATPAGVQTSEAQANSPAAWSKAIAPFRIVGPIHYIGTEGIASYLIETGDGLILLDGGLAESVPDLERSIVSLGFRLSDVKLLIATHAHWDHAAGLAALKRDTGAAFAASAADRQAYETGIPPSEVSYGVSPFAPLKVDRTLTDGQPITLGHVAMTPVITPGHTPGCTSWTMRVTDAGRALDIVFPCSISVAGNKLVGNRGYPGIVGDFRRTFARMRELPADIVLTAHPELADVLGRAGQRDAGDKTAFVAPDLLRRLVDEAETAFAAELAKQEGA
jgi:metallo-beta-lactamase class B